MTAKPSGAAMVHEGPVTDDHADDVERIHTDRELPIPNYDDMSVRAAKIRLDGLTKDELQRLRAYEAENKQRKTLLNQIDRRLTVVRE